MLVSRCRRSSSVLSEPIFYRIGASVLSHYVGDFPLVTAFFLFSVGCVNMLVGLIFREKVKDKRSILSWRERSKDVLPSHVRGIDVRPVTGTLSSVLSREDKASDPTRTLSDASSRSGMGFGRQGEKSAALKGMYASTAPEASLNEYPRFPSHEAGGIPSKTRSIKLMLFVYETWLCCLQVVSIICLLYPRTSYGLFSTRRNGFPLACLLLVLTTLQ